MNNDMQTNKRCFTPQKKHFSEQDEPSPVPAKHEETSWHVRTFSQGRADNITAVTVQFDQWLNLTVHLSKTFYHLIWLSSRICFNPLWCLSQWCTTRTFIQKYYVAGVHDTCPACLPRCSCVQQHLVATVSFTGTLGRLCYHLTQLGSCECPSSHLIDFWKSVVKFSRLLLLYTLGLQNLLLKFQCWKSDLLLMADIPLYTL